MLVCAAISTPRVYEVDGLIVFGSELTNPGLAYFMINRASAGDDGAHHYVEMWDQVFGRFDGLEGLELAVDRRSLVLHLNFDVNSQGRVFRVECNEPMDSDSANWIDTLAAELKARQ